MKTPPTVYIIDDEAAVRDALLLLLSEADIAVEAYENAEAFLRLCHPHAPCCAIVDLSMPGMDGLQLQQEMNRRGIRLPVIFLSGHGDIPISVKAIKAGAVDFLTKPVASATLLEAVRNACQECTQRTVGAAGGPDDHSGLASLTEREREVMSLAVAGHSNKEIARRLGISHRTVEIHKTHIMHKTGAVNLLELARLAQQGDLSP